MYLWVCCERKDPFSANGPSCRRVKALQVHLMGNVILCSHEDSAGMHEHTGIAHAPHHFSKPQLHAINMDMISMGNI